MLFAPPLPHRIPALSGSLPHPFLSSEPVGRRFPEIQANEIICG